MNDNKPSRTAYKVALNILVLGEKPQTADILPPGTADATERLLIASGAAKPRTVRWYRSPRMVRICEAFEWMMPGQFEAFAHRKAFCERQIREGIQNGASQILLLGAGYDALGWLLAPEFPEVSFFEIDHPATASLKAKGIESMGIRPNLHLIAEDLGQRKLMNVLAANETWNRNASTVIVAEGLLQYLAAEAVEDLFRQCASVTGHARMAFTYSVLREDGQPDAGPCSGLVLWSLKMGGEPWLWCTRPDELSSFLAKVGWNVVEQFGKHGVEMYAVAVKSCEVQTKQDIGG